MRQSKKRNPYNITREKKITRRMNVLFIVFAIAWILYYSLLQPKIIGHDIRRSIFVTWLPLLAGVIALGIYRYRIMYYEYLRGEKFWSKCLLLGMFLVYGIFFSFISTGLAAQIIWDRINCHKADGQPSQQIICPVTSFVWHKNDHHIGFRFQGKQERINTATAKDYYHEKPAGFQLQLTIREGIWNHYVVKDWQLIDNR